MVNVKKSRVIDADPQKIWEIINQVERYPEWMPNVIEAHIVSEPRRKQNGLGRRQLLKTQTKFGIGEILQEVIVWEPPYRITWQHLKDVIGGQEVEHAQEIKTTISITNRNGEITFRMIGSWQPSGHSGQSMNRIMKREMEKNFEAALLNLERLIKKERSRKRKS